MPTYGRLVRFDRDYAALNDKQKAAFKDAVKKMIEDLKAKKGFRKGLRVKRVQGTQAVFEMTWAPDGRATFQYGDEVKRDVHIIWRRIGTHDVFDSP